MAEHRKYIERAHSTLKVDDFYHRALVVSTGWETGAEDFLIQLFRPVWNKETNLVFGFGKHGDSASTRGNKRSPWDTLHPGRGWAVDTKEDAKALPQITSELKDHFASHPAFRKLDDVMAAFLASLRQH